MSESTNLMFEGGLSGSLRSLIEREREGIDSVVRKAVQMILKSVPDYALSNDSRMIEDLANSARINLKLWFSALLDSTVVTGESIEPITVYARRRVHQGISMTGLLRAYRVIVRVIWMEMLEKADTDADLKAELATKVSPYLLDHFDVVAAAIASGYLQEQSQHARWRDRLRQELWTIIRSRPDDLNGFRELGEPLGLAVDHAHCAVALKLSEEACSRPERFIDPPLLSLGRKLEVPSESLMRALHHGHLVIWIPQPGGQPAVEFERRLATIVAALCSLSHALIAAGVGLPGVGPHGWRASMEQAFRAFSATGTCGEGGLVHRYSRVMFDDAIRTSRNVADFVRSSVEALSGEAHLLDTLQAYLKFGLHRKEAAKALGIHPNTLDNRLSRIEVLLDGSFSDVNWIEQVHAAVRLRHK